MEKPNSSPSLRRCNISHETQIHPITKFDKPTTYDNCVGLMWTKKCYPPTSISHYSRAPHYLVCPSQPLPGVLGLLLVDILQYFFPPPAPLYVYTDVGVFVLSS